jgi:hypothetical protein
VSKIGLLADSHGQAARTRRAAELLAQAGAELLIHLGDLCAENVLDALLTAGPNPKTPLLIHVIFGNMDADIPQLTRYAAALGFHVDHPAGSLDLPADRRLIFMHGHDPVAMRQALADGVTYLCHGHTHRAADQRRDRTRIINPGALFRAPVYSVAMLDTDADDLRFYQLD